MGLVFNDFSIFVQNQQTKNKQNLSMMIICFLSNFWQVKKVSWQEKERSSQKEKAVWQQKEDRWHTKGEWRQDEKALWQVKENMWQDIKWALECQKAVSQTEL